ncbi:hypothetical protein EQU24_07795 [Methylotuvimicrobium buryatense]|uniref:Uncharacterized protein n=1 Tax=Methylotuvimicrobium buryatense TaxID=95641 RepID=A0A4P9ULS6_METBY|nr:hypothetical protein EQU24_07795 [Methylotuvimicrobium buryatense]
MGYAWRGCRQQGAAAKPPWMGLRRSSTGIPHTLKSAKLLKLGIANLIAKKRQESHFLIITQEIR